MEEEQLLILSREDKRRIFNDFSSNLQVQPGTLLHTAGHHPIISLSLSLSLAQSRTHRVLTRHGSFLVKVSWTKLNRTCRNNDGNAVRFDQSGFEVAPSPISTYLLHPSPIKSSLVIK